MSSSGFSIICGTGFLAVFLLLLLLSIAMRLLTLLFPERSKEESCVPEVAVIAATLNFLYPGTKITRIERQNDFHKDHQNNQSHVHAL